MELLVVGINHETAPVALRERVAFTPDQLAHALPALGEYAGLAEIAILSTCNRTEVIAVPPMGGRHDNTATTIGEWLCQYHNLNPQLVQDCLYHFTGDEAVQHMFRVAAGLDSMVLGEPQILGQVKDSFNQARQHATLGQQLDRLSQATNRVAKVVRTETGIGNNSVSAAATSVSLARQLFTDLSACTALFIGAGETIELAATHLRQAGVTQMVIANRTLGNAERLAARFDARAIDLSGIPAQLVATDIVIASTAAQLPVLGKGTVERALRERRHRPIFLVDLAVPRDIEPEVAELRDAYLYSIDDLQGIIDQNLSERQDEARKAEAIISQEVTGFVGEERSLVAVETLVRFRRKHEDLKSQELERAVARLEKGEDPRKVLSAFANQLTNKLIHTPSIKLKEAGKSGREDLLEAIEQVFELKDPGRE